VCVCVCARALQVGSPAQVHLAEQLVVGGLLDEVVNVALDGERQAEHFVPALDHPLQALLDIAHVGLGLGGGQTDLLIDLFSLELHRN